MRGRGDAETRGRGGSPRFRVPASARLFFLLILALAALLRCEGLLWGLPNARHWFSYHPDEFLVLGAADRVNLFAGQWNPGFYNYGSFLIYLISVTADIVNAWAPLPAKAPPYVLLARLTIIGRAWVALLGIAGVYVVYLIGRKLAGERFGERAGILSALTLAVLPMHAVHSHFVTVDVPATFWVAVALYNALRYPQGKRAALWCGISAGLAAGTKYNAGLVLLAGWAAVWLARDTSKAARWRAMGVMTGATALAFFLSTPGFLLAPGAFWRDFGYEAHHVATGHGLVFINTGPGWWYHLTTNLWYGIGAFLPIAALAALVVLLWHRRVPTPPRLRAAWPLLAFALPYFALISAAAVRFQRYDVPLLPVLCAGAGALFARLPKRWLLLPAAALFGTLVLAQGDVSTMSAPRGKILATGFSYRGDPRTALADYLDARARPGARIGLFSVPWFYTPPLNVANAGPQSRSLFFETRNEGRFPLVLPDVDGGTAFAAWPDLVVLSDYEIGDALRLQGVSPPERAAQVQLVPVDPNSPAEAQRLTRLWNNVLKRYQLLGVWSPTPHAFGVTWAKRKLPPHDAFYPYPTLFLFGRVK